MVPDAGRVAAQGVGLNDAAVPPAVVPVIEGDFARARVTQGPARELGLHLGAPGAGLCLEGERLAEAVSRPVAYGRLPLAGCQFPEVRGSTPCSTTEGFGSRCGISDGPWARCDRPAADELLKPGSGDTHAGASGTGTEIDDGQVAGGNEAVDGATVDVQSGGDSRYGEQACRHGEVLGGAGGVG